MNFEGNNYQTFTPYDHIIKDGRDIYTHALEMH